MPSPKNSLAKTRPSFGRDTYTAELTSGQLVIGVCILISFGLACFMLGVLIGRMQPAERPELARNDSEALPPPSRPVQGEANPAGTIPSGNAALPVETPERPDSAPAAETDPPVQPAPGESGMATQAVDLSETTLPTPAQEPQVTVTPALEEPLEESPPDALSNADGRLPVELEPPAESPASGTPRNSRAAALRGGPPEGGYTLQAGVFSQSKNAEAIRLKIQTESAYTVDLIPTGDGRNTLVLVGHFPDRASAQRACDELRAKKVIPDCLVRRRPKASPGIAAKTKKAESIERRLTLKRPDIERFQPSGQ